MQQQQPSNTPPAMDPRGEVREALGDFHEYLTPTENRLVVVKPRGAWMPQARRTATGLFMPQRSELLAREHGLICRVVKVGPKCERAWRIGETVLVPTYSGLPIYATGTTLEAWLIAECDVVALVDESIWERLDAEEEGLPRGDLSPTVCTHGRWTCGPCQWVKGRALTGSGATLVRSGAQDARSREGAETP